MILSPNHWSYDISHSFFPNLPLEDAKERINHNLMVCLMNEKQAARNLYTYPKKKLWN